MASSISLKCEAGEPSPSFQSRTLNNSGDDIDVRLLVTGVDSRNWQKYGDLGTYLTRVFDRNKVRLVPKGVLSRTDRQKFEDEITTLKGKLTQKDGNIKSANRKIGEMKKKIEDLEKVRTRLEHEKETGSKAEIERLQRELKEVTERAESLQRAKSNQENLFEDFKRQWTTKNGEDNAKLAKTEENCRNLESLLRQANLKNQELISELEEVKATNGKLWETTEGKKLSSHGQTEIIALKNEKERLLQDFFRFKAFIRELIKSTGFPEQINDDDFLNSEVLKKLHAHINSTNEKEIDREILNEIQNIVNRRNSKSQPGLHDCPSDQEISPIRNGGIIAPVPTTSSIASPSFSLPAIEPTDAPDPKQNAPVTTPLSAEQLNEDSYMGSETPPNCLEEDTGSTRASTPDITIVETLIRRPSVIKPLVAAVEEASVAMISSTGDEDVPTPLERANGQRTPSKYTTMLHDDNVTNTSNVSLPPPVVVETHVEDKSFDLDSIIQGPTELPVVYPGRRGRGRPPARGTRRGRKRAPCQTNEDPTEEPRKMKNQKSQVLRSQRHRKPRNRPDFLPTSYAAPSLNHISPTTPAPGIPQHFDDIEVIENHNEDQEATSIGNEITVHNYPSPIVIASNRRPSTQNLVSHNAPIYGCRGCPEVFDSFENLNAHISTNHKNGSIQGIRCGLCKPKTRTMFVLNNTLLSHAVREHQWAFQ